MVRVGNLITNNLSNAYAVGAVSLHREMHVERRLSSVPVRVHVHLYATNPAKHTTKYRKAITTFDTITRAVTYAYAVSYMHRGLLEIGCYITDSRNPC